MKFRRASVYKYLGFFYFEVTTEKSFDPKPVFIKLNNLKGTNGRSLKVKINKGVYNIN